MNCKHYILGELVNTGLCACTDMIWNLETGESRHEFASHERDGVLGACGPEAELFEAKEQDEAA